MRFALVICSALIAAGQSAIELARKAPPELFADAVIKTVESNQIPSPEQRKMLLEEAFEAAKAAREPIRLLAMPGIPSDSRAALRESAGALGLDALSLQVRIVKDMAM